MGSVLQQSCGLITEPNCAVIGAQSMHAISRGNSRRCREL